MNLSSPDETYSRENEAQTRDAIARADGRNRKLGQDVELAVERLILRSPDGTRWKLNVSNAGVLSATSL